MAYLTMSYTDPDTQAVYPNAVVVITNWKIQGDPPAAEVDLYYYVNQTAHTANLPFHKRLGVVLTATEINTWIMQFAQAGYQTLAARAEFTGATVVLP